MNKEPNKQLTDAVFNILSAIGEDPKRAGLKDTPDRVARSWRELTRGYTKFSKAVRTFPSKYTGIVLRTHIPFSSLCEHHLLPYSGTIDFAYIPDGKIIGISKIVRLFQHYSARLTIQEELTEDMVEAFSELVNPKGCAIKISALHACESCRGISVSGVSTVTNFFSGCFVQNNLLVNQFYQLLHSEGSK